MSDNEDTPWSVRGVPIEIRRTAKVEAWIEGKAVGEWVAEAIVAYVSIKKTVRTGKLVLPEAPKKSRSKAKEGGGEVEAKVQSPAEKWPEWMCVHGVNGGNHCWKCKGPAIAQRSNLDGVSGIT